MLGQKSLCEPFAIERSDYVANKLSNACSRRAIHGNSKQKNEETEE
jgi:hypothetical protein